MHFTINQPTILQLIPPPRHPNPAVATDPAILDQYLASAIHRSTFIRHLSPPYHRHPEHHHPNLITIIIAEGVPERLHPHQLAVTINYYFIDVSYKSGYSLGSHLPPAQVVPHLFDLYEPY